MNLILIFLSAITFFSREVASVWTQIGSDINGESADDIFGESVAMSSDGSVLAVGAQRNDGNGIDSGHVRVYRNINDVWTQIGSDINGESAYYYSGFRFAMSSDGSVLAVGAIYNDGNGSNSGHVRVYRNINDVWTQIGSDINGESADDWSERSVAMSLDGSVLAVGAMRNDGNGNNSGHVRVYRNIDDVWTQIGSDINGESANDESGFVVAMSLDGSVLAVGARINDGNGIDSGHVRVYRNINNVWTQIGSDINGESAADFSGESVAMSSDGSVLAVGAPRNDDNGDNSGHVRVYRNINDVWTQIGSDINGESAYYYSDINGKSSDDRFGLGVAMSSDGSVLAVGARRNDGNGSNSGHVCMYRNINDVWTQIGSDITGESADDISGISLAMSSDGGVLAVRVRNDGNGQDSGHVRVYRDSYTFDARFCGFEESCAAKKCKKCNYNKKICCVSKIQNLDKKCQKARCVKSSKCKQKGGVMYQCKN